MKKIYILAAAAILSTTVFAQNKTVVSGELNEITPKEQAKLNNFATPKLNSINNQNNKAGQLTDVRIDYAAELLTLLGGTVEYTFSNPMMPDSTTYIAYTSTVNSVGTHGIGMVYDKNDAFYGANRFNASDVVTVDSIFMDAAYWINNSAHTNDSVIFSVVVGAPAAPNFEVAGFSGLAPHAGTVNIPFLSYVGDPAHGTHNGLTATVTERIAYHLTQADSAGVAQIAVETSGITVGSGQVLAVFVEYAPTSFAAGDTSDLVNDMGAFNVLRPLALGNASGQDYNNFTGLAAGSSNHNSIFLTNATRYNNTVTNTGNTDGSTYSLWTLSNSIYLTVSGNSTVGIDELNNNSSFDVYPNPSAGLFNINLDANNNTMLTVRNVVGQTVINENVSGKSNHTISLADYSKGVYFLTIGEETVKLIVE